MTIGKWEIGKSLVRLMFSFFFFFGEQMGLIIYDFGNIFHVNVWLSY